MVILCMRGHYQADRRRQDCKEFFHSARIVRNGEQLSMNVLFAIVKHCTGGQNNSCPSLKRGPMLNMGGGH